MPHKTARLETSPASVYGTKLGYLQQKVDKKTHENRKTDYDGLQGQPIRYTIHARDAPTQRIYYC